MSTAPALYIQYSGMISGTRSVRWRNEVGGSVSKKETILNRCDFSSIKKHMCHTAAVALRVQEIKARALHPPVEASQYVHTLSRYAK